MFVNCQGINSTGKTEQNKKTKNKQKNNNKKTDKKTKQKLKVSGVISYLCHEHLVEMLD